MRFRIIFWMLAVMALMPAKDVKAQGIVDVEDEEFFRSLFPAKSSDEILKSYYKERFRRRFSFHTNALEWMLTMPNFGIEIDLNNKRVLDDNKKRTWKTNRTLLFSGKINPQMKHSVTPKFVFNIMAARMEYRKYWRSGKVGLNNFYHEDYKIMNLYKPDTLWRKVYDIDEYGDTLPKMKKVPYFNAKDSAWLESPEEYEGDPNRGRFSNLYENSRRAISTRTIENARNWRAYYIGAFAGLEKFSWCIGSKGEQGTLASLGAVFGYSVPIFAPRDKEYGLDLDVGMSIGVPVAKYEGYKYIDNGGYAHYAREGRRLEDGWGLNAKYALRDIHVSLVYRFRSIGRKVSLAIVDDYQKHIDAWNKRQREVTEEKERIRSLYEHRRDSILGARRHASDSVSWYEWQRKDYLIAKKEIYPGIQFHGQDSLDYIRLVLGRDLDEYKDEQIRLKRKEKKGNVAEDSLNYLRNRELRDSILLQEIQNRQQSVKMSDSLKVLEKFRRDSAERALDSLRRIHRDANSLRRDSIQKVKDAERERIRAQKEAEKQKKQDAKNAALTKKLKAEAEENERKQAAKTAKEAEEAKKKAEKERKEQEKRIEREVQRRLDEDEQRAKRKQK